MAQIIKPQIRYEHRLENVEKSWKCSFFQEVIFHEGCRGNVENCVVVVVLCKVFLKGKCTKNPGDLGGFYQEKLDKENHYVLKKTDHWRHYSNEKSFCSLQ